MGPMHRIALHEEDVASLVGRAHARVRFPDLRFEDPLAEAVLERVDVDVHRFDDARLRAAAVAAIAMDRVVRRFFRRHPEGLAVALHPGLCTRFSRVDNGRLRWIDIDPPGVAEVKCELYTTPDRHMVATCGSLTSCCWMEPLRQAAGVPLLLISQGALQRCSPAELDAFLVRMSECLPEGTEMLLDHDARRPWRRSSTGKRHASLEVRMCDRHTARYPRIRFIPADEPPPGVEQQAADRGGAASDPRGRGVPSVAHLRLVA